jgi:hypothetical protein
MNGLLIRLLLCCLSWNPSDECDSRVVTIDCTANLLVFTSTTVQHRLLKVKLKGGNPTSSLQPNLTRVASRAVGSPQVDKYMEDALRQTVKRSLMDLSRALNGDAKTDVTPIFNTLVALDRSTGKVELRPSVSDLVDMIHAVCRESITVITVVPRLAEPLPQDPNASDLNGPAPLPTFYEVRIGWESEETNVSVKTREHCGRKGFKVARSPV